MKLVARLLAALALAAHGAAAFAIVIFIPAPRVDISQIEEGTGAVVATGAIFEGPTYVDAGSNVAFMRTPAAIDSGTMVRAFADLCIDTNFDQAAFDTAAAASALRLKRKDIVLPPLGKTDAPVTVTDWQSSSVRAMLWPASTGALKNRQSYERMRAGASVGAFRPRKTAIAECDMLFDVTGMRDPLPIIAALTAKLGAEPAKVVTKPKWADGHWSIVGNDGFETRVVYSVLDMAQAAQTIHIAIIKAAPAIK